MMGMGLNCTVLSYIDSVDFGMQCDPELIANPWAITDRIPDALAQLLKAGTPKPAVRPRAKQTPAPRATRPVKVTATKAAKSARVAKAAKG
jgi:hypothetical protein